MSGTINGWKFDPRNTYIYKYTQMQSAPPNEPPKPAPRISDLRSLMNPSIADAFMINQQETPKPQSPAQPSLLSLSQSILQSQTVAVEVANILLKLNQEYNGSEPDAKSKEKNDFQDGFIQDPIDCSWEIVPISQNNK